MAWIDRNRWGVRDVARRGLRLWAVAAALTGALAHGASTAHMLLSPHAVCQEHGELVHAGVHAGVNGSAGSTELHGHGMPVGEALMGLTEADAGEHDHEHCRLACSRTKLLLGALLAAEQAAAPALLVAAPPRTAPAHDQCERHRLAPKQSPPA